MTNRLIVVTHKGSGNSIVETIFNELGAELHFISSVEEARERVFDRVILLGGGDIMPFWYGEPRRGSHEPNKDRDLIEWALVRRAFTDQCPILGICRGHQMLAVAAGGALHQDIGTRKAEHDTNDNHNLVGVMPVLQERLPTSRVNSHHHQAIKAMPPGFVVAARSRDGVIEAIYRPGYVGVQFHPEYLFQTDHRWITIFRWLLDGLN